MLGEQAMQALAGKVARDLVRNSKGHEKSPDDQHKAHLRSAKANGWVLEGPSYRDLVSASKFGPEVREDFERLIADLRADTFNADILMMWENSRGSRRESEWLQLIELAELRDVVFWIDVRERLMDPKNPHDRRDLVHAAADAAYESGLLSFRSSRGIAEAATDGLPHGKIPYGYRRVYDDKTGDFVEQVPDPKEAPVIRDLFKRVGAGQSLRSIAALFAKRGIEKRSGGPFSAAHLRSFLDNEAYIGIRIHDPERVGGRILPGAEVRKVKAVWPPLVTKKLFDDVQRLLSDSSRRKNRDGGAKHFLSMIVRCASCLDVVIMRPCHSSGELRYACRTGKRGCGRTLYEDLDKLVEQMIIGWLADPESYGTLGRADAAANEKLSEVRAELDKAIADRDDLADRVGRNEPGFSLAFAAKVAAGIEERITRLEAEEQTLRPSVLEGLIEPGPDVAKRWKALTRDSRRRVARLLLVPEYVGEVRIKQVGRGRRLGPVLEQLQVVRQKAA